MASSLPGPVVTPDWLAARRSDPALRILDATWFLPGDTRSAASAFHEAHIPGAVRADLDVLSDPASPLPHMAPSASEFERLVADLGVGAEDVVVVYDAIGMFSAARIWWLFQLFGHDRAAVLDGGLPAWRRQGLPIETGENRPRPPATPFRAAYQPDRVADLEAVRAHLASHGTVLDARPADRFAGLVPEPRPGLRAGAMPGAKSLPFSTVLTAEGAFRPEAELRDLFAAFEDPIVCTCGSGVTAAILAVALASIGRHAAVYDGSWAEWGARSDTPVVALS